MPIADGPLITATFISVFSAFSSEGDGAGCGVGVADGGTGEAVGTLAVLHAPKPKHIITVKNIDTTRFIIYYHFLSLC
jgi:hypothetical protein